MQDIELARIPAGAVTLHDARRNERREVLLQEFEIGVYAVTQEQLSALIGEGEEHPHPRRPAVNVTWQRAIRFCKLDPARYGDYRVFRGGGFADEAWNVRASVRRGGAPRMHHDDLGFRVARGGFDSANEAQGWSEAADRERAAVAGLLPTGWTPRR